MRWDLKMRKVAGVWWAVQGDYCSAPSVRRETCQDQKQVCRACLAQVCILDWPPVVEEEIVRWLVQRKRY